MKRAFFVITLLCLLFITASAQVSFTVQTTPICSSTSQVGEASFTVTSGTPPYSYQWYGPVTGSGTSSTLTGLPAGNYNVTVTDDLSASSSKFFTIDSIFVKIHVDTSTICDGRLFIRVEDNNGFFGNLSGGPYDFDGYNYIVTENNTDYYASYTSPSGCTVADTFNSGIIPKLETNITVSQYTCDWGSYVTAELIGSNPSDVIHDVFVDWDRFYNQYYEQQQRGTNNWELIHGVYIITSRDTSASMLAQCPDNFVNDTLFVDADASVAGNDFYSGATITAVANDTCSNELTLTGSPAFMVSGWNEYTWTGPNNFRDTGQTITITEPSSTGFYYYDLTINTTGCLGQTSIYDNDLPFPDGFSISLSASVATCANNGSATASTNNNNNTYSYYWDTGDTTSTITSLTAGTYWVTVTSSNGCTHADSITVQNTSGSIIQLDSTTIVSPTCNTSANGSIQVFATAIAPINSYLWSNGDTTATITDLLPGTYAVTISDTSGCTYRHSVVLDDTGLQLQIDKTQLLDCATATGGTLKVAANAGTAPYTYIWNTGATSDSIANLGVGAYTVTVTDDNGCSETIHYSLDPEPSCYAQLSGKVYIDTDSSCTFNSGDIGLSGRMVKIEPGFYAYTNSSGDWQTQVAPGQQYKTFLVANGPSLINNACSIDTLSVSVPDTNNIGGLDLPKHTSATNDVAISMWALTARPGFTSSISVVINNYGFNTVNGSGSIELDDKYTSVVPSNVNANITIDSISSSAPYIVYFSYSGLLANSFSSFQLEATLPAIPLVNLGEILYTTAQVTDDLGTDIVMSNNTDTLSVVVTGAYDPNDKHVFANETDIDGLASPADTLLEYLVRFQNTGNDTAFRVVVRDTLDTALDPGTFRVLASSHPVDVQFYESHIIHFVFDNILLPDSNVNETASHGFVAFEIEIAEPGLLQPISNQAAIYFDYNPPIYTNTVTSTPAEVPVISGIAALCLGENTVLRADTLSQFSYIWTNNGMPVSGFTGDSLPVASAGDYNIALVHGDDTLWSAAKQVVINALPSTSLSAVTTSMCADAQAVSISVSPTGGTLSGTGISGSDFDPTTAGAGTHTIEYLYTDGNGCSNTATETLTVNAKPTTTLTPDATAVCEDASLVAVVVSPTGGTLTGTGISGTDFDPATAGAGMHTIEYLYTDGNGCSNTATETLTVNPKPTTTLTPDATAVCEDAQAVSISVSPTGGTLSGDGISGTDFDPATAGAGTHTIEYLYTDGNGCSNTATETLTVNAKPTTTLTPDATAVCEDAQAVSISVSPTGGTLSGDGISGTDFDPATAGAGTHTIEYLYTDGNGCSNTATETLTVNAKPTTTLTPDATAVCEDASLVAVVVSPTGGTLTGDGISGTDFDPATAGAGTHTIEYLYTDGNGCSNTANATVVVTELPLASLSLPSEPFCKTNVPIDLSSYVDPVGGVITSTVVSGNMLDASATGTYTIEYTYTDNNGCAKTAQASIVVDECIGIEEVNAATLAVFPNPTTGLLFVSIDGNTIDQIELYNMTGQQLQSHTYGSVTQAQLNMNELANGMYMLRVNSGNTWHTERVVLQR